MQNNVLSPVGHRRLGKHLGSMPQLTQDAIAAPDLPVMQPHIDVDFASDRALPYGCHGVYGAGMEGNRIMRHDDARLCHTIRNIHLQL